jgi:hypothetical protein
MDQRRSFETRGVVLVPEDLTLKDWPERAQRAGLTTTALHLGSSPWAVARGEPTFIAEYGAGLRSWRMG